jgi:hypothetical protein
MIENEEVREEIPKTAGTPGGRLEYVERRIDCDIDRIEGDLRSLGRLKEDVVLARAMELLLRDAGVESQPSTPDYTLPLVERMHEVYPETKPADTTDLLVTSGSAVASYYSGVTGSYPYYEDPGIRDRADNLAREYEHLHTARNIRGEVVRKLLWVSEVAAGKFEAAWDGFHARIPSVDPTSGPALEMRSALTSAVDSIVDRLPTAEGSLNRRRCIEHIAQHAARSRGTQVVLEGLATRYVRLLQQLSAVKDKTDLGRDRLRSLMFEATDFLHSLLEAIDYPRLGSER